MTRIPAPARIVVIGSVFSSQRTLEGLIRHRAPVVGVLGLDPAAAGGVSGYRDLGPVAKASAIEHCPFRRLDEPAAEQRLRAWEPDLVFVVGLSQLVGADLLSIATTGFVGFHPTALPAGRGRAPIAWLVLDGAPAAATFFLLDDGVDAGPILHQEPIDLDPGDTAGDLEVKISSAIDRALDAWLPVLLGGKATCEPQDEAAATYRGRRTERDGRIDWSAPAAQIDRLVRASTRPHPGAYTYAGGSRLRVWETELADGRHRGVTGRVLARRTTDGALLVQAGDLPIWLVSHELEPPADPPRVGAALGYRAEDEIHDLRQRVASLEARLDALEGPR